MSMAVKEAAADLAAEEKFESSSLSIALVQSSGHGPRFSDTGSFLQPVLPPRTRDSILSQEQVLPSSTAFLFAFSRHRVTVSCRLTNRWVCVMV